MPESEELSSQAQIWNTILSITDSFALKCALKLKIFDAIHRHSGPISLPALAAALPAPCGNPSLLLRLLRYLSHIGLITITADDPPLFSLPPSSSSLLVASSDRSLASFATILLDEAFLGALHALDASVSGGEGSGFGSAAMGVVMSRGFNEGMAESGRATAEAVAGGAAEVFEGVGTVVDVGGGMGTAARVIRGRFEGVRVLVLDLGHVVEGLEGGDGVEFVVGDMFVDVPKADAVLLMVIIEIEFSVFLA